MKAQTHPQKPKSTSKHEREEKKKKVKGNLLNLKAENNQKAIKVKEKSLILNGNLKLKIL